MKNITYFFLLSWKKYLFKEFSYDFFSMNFLKILQILSQIIFLKYILKTFSTMYFLKTIFFINILMVLSPLNFLISQDNFFQRSSECV